MKTVAFLLVALVLCIGIIEARPRPGSNGRYRYRPAVRYTQGGRYNERYGQYVRYRPQRLLAEGDVVPEADVPVSAQDDAVADFPEPASFPVDFPVALDPVPESDVPLSASPDESYDHETRLLPEPDYRAAAPEAKFFPVSFDRGVTGGTVAIANSYSTGNGGRSESRAVAFGNPDAARYLGQY